MNTLRWTPEQLAAHQGRRDPQASLHALGRMPKGRMNKTETRYAQRLAAMLVAGEILWWQFEPIKLRLADATFYTPDFALQMSDGRIELHEIKGSRKLWKDDARVKIKVAAELFPIFTFRALYPQPGGFWDQEDFA